MLVSLFDFLGFFSLCFFSFFGADCIEESDDCEALESCANTGIASDTARAAAKSKVNAFFMLGCTLPLIWIASSDTQWNCHPAKILKFKISTLSSEA